MPTSSEIAAMSGPAAFRILVRDSGKNIAFFGFGMIAIVLIAEFVSWWFALVLFAGFVLVTLLSVFHQVMLLIANIVYFFSLVFGRRSGRGKAFLEYVFLSAANLVQILAASLPRRWCAFRFCLSRE